MQEHITPNITRWLHEHKITQKQIEAAVLYMEKNFKNTPMTLEQFMVKSGVVKPEDVNEKVSSEPISKVEVEEKPIIREINGKRIITESDINPGLMTLVPEKILKEKLIIPLGKENNHTLILGMVDITDYKIADEIRTIYDVKKIEKVPVDEASLVELYNKIFKFNVADEETDETDFGDGDEDGDDDFVDNDSPIIKFVNDLLYRAIAMGVSDVHIEPQVRRNTRIRFRLDGELIEFTEIPKKWHHQMVSRVKIMGNMDISNRYEPQDGEIKYKYKDSHINLRVNILPLVNNEKIVIRVLGQAETLLPLEKVGLSQKNYEYVLGAIHKKQGLVLVTGPTGSGKTTTMYAMLQKINSINKNISTIEDPVELSVPGLNQVQVSKRISFADTLRALLRQDPDIIMIGEIRDTETAEIAVRSSLTGHIVVSTLHTNNALSTITRLMDMGVEPYLLADALNLVVSQRLVRRICEKCKLPDVNGLEELKRDFAKYIEGAENIQIYKGVGCEACGKTGYKGRLPVQEVVLVEDDLRALMIQEDVQKIRSYGEKNGMVEDVIGKLLEGITTIDEAKKILLDL